MNKPKRKIKSFIKFKIFFLIIISALAMTIAYITLSFDSKILPIAVSLSEIQARNKINTIILESVNNVTLQNNIGTSDFYIKTEDERGLIQSLTVNTVLVNDVCSKIAAEISRKMEGLKKEAIEIPIGVLSGVEVFSNLGPKYAISLMPSGNITADYETRFDSVGINQINFQVWINVSTTIQILIPLSGQNITVNRKIALVNTVFSGHVPETYFNTAPTKIQ